MGPEVVVPHDIIDSLVPGYVDTSFEERRRARVAAVSLVMCMVVTTLNAVGGVLAGKNLNALIDLAVGVGCAFVLWQLRRGRGLVATSVALLSVQVGGALVSAVATDGVVNLMTPWAVVPPLFAQVQLGRRAAWLTAAVMCAATATLFFLERSGVFVPPSGTQLLNLEGDRIFAYSLATVIVLLLTQAVEAERARARALADAEAQRERDRVRQAQLWKLIAGMAHEINNPLAALSLNLQFATAVIVQCGKCIPDVPIALKETTASTDRVAALINDLRLVTSLGDSAPERVALHDVAQQVARDAVQHIRVNTSPAFVHANVAAIERTLYELLRNLRWSIHDQTAEITMTVRRDGDQALVQLCDGSPSRQPCEFPVAQFLALHAGGTLSMEQVGDRHCVSLRLPALA